MRAVKDASLDAQADGIDISRPSTPERSHLAYRPQLDGLRAVAVYLVVAFHAGLGWFSGGFIGVDVFFVLSGFLVTGILLRNVLRFGRPDFKTFYARRARRILPAAALTLVVTALLYARIASASESQDALGGFRSAFLYVANWHFIRQSTDYFAAGTVGGNPVLHFWSLSVEEQFYLVWPLLFGGLFLLSQLARRSRWWVLRAMVLALGLLSVIEAWHLGSTNVIRAYYGTDTRAYQLLAGAFLALTPQLLKLGKRWRKRMERLAAVALIALVAVGTSVFDVSPITRGVMAAVATALLIASLENAGATTTKRGLSWGPMTYLGRVSYGTYLWHWPLIVLLTHGHSIAPLQLFVIVAPLSTLLAMLSFHVVEMPIRSSRALNGYRVPVIASGIAVSLIGGLVIAPAILDRGGSTIAALSPPTAGKLQLLNWRAAKDDVPALPDCLDRPVDVCVVVHGHHGRMILVGDSNARMWIPTFTEIARRRGMSFAIAVYPGCPWQLDLQYATSRDVLKKCARHQHDWYDREIPQFNPNVVLLAQGPYDDPNGPNSFVDHDGHSVTASSDAFEPLLQDATRTSLARLAKSGRKLVLIEPEPLPLFDPLACISSSAPSRCSYTANRQPTPLEQYYRTIAAPPRTFDVDLDRVVCPRWPTCDVIVDNIIVKRDLTHLTATFALSRASIVDGILARAGVLG